MTQGSVRQVGHLNKNGQTAIIDKDKNMVYVH